MTAPICETENSCNNPKTEHVGVFKKLHLKNQYHWMDFLECESHELRTSMAERYLLSTGHEKPLPIPLNQPH
jgi:hypothetical protein